MAYFAQVDESNFVLEVQIISDDDLDNLAFPESELVGQAFQSSLGIAGTWLQCSIDGSFRGAYPGPGYSYDATLDEFIAPAIDEETP